MVSDRGMKPLKGDQQLRSVSLSYSVALQALKPKSSPRRIRAGMQAPIEVSRREGEVFLLDILSHRMSVMATSITNRRVFGIISMSYGNNSFRSTAEVDTE